MSVYFFIEKAMKYVICVMLFIFSTSLSQEKTQKEIEQEKQFQDRAAQVNTDTTRVYGWHHNIITGMNLTQVSFKDWAQGGENALAYSLWLKVNSIQTLEKTEWSSSGKFAFGQTRLSSQGLRKTDDEIFLQTLFIYKLGTYINPYVAATLRTQFATGYQYTNNLEIPVSKFFDPAYLIQSVGVAYKPIMEITTRIGAGAREIVTSEFSFYANGKKVKTDGGLESNTDLAFTIMENVVLTSKLDLFAPFNEMDRIIVRNDNSIVARVNKYITMNLDVNLINDVNILPRTQVKQTLAAGLSYTLL
jgi:hypothetical protein